MSALAILACGTYTGAMSDVMNDENLNAVANLGSLSDHELRSLIDQLTTEEQKISYERRILHGKIDLLRAELVNRLRKRHQQGESIISGDDVDQLTNILSGASGLR
jgi:hypothetical protein